MQLIWIHQLTIYIDTCFSGYKNIICPASQHTAFTISFMSVWKSYFRWLKTVKKDFVGRATHLRILKIIIVYIDGRALRKFSSDIWRLVRWRQPHEKDSIGYFLNYGDSFKTTKIWKKKKSTFKSLPNMYHKLNQVSLTLLSKII